MKYNPDIHKRRSIRLKEYNYSQQGAYFVTMCTWQRECLFGDITDRGIMLNDAGDMINKWWIELTNKFKNIELDKCVIMPNHFHGIISIVGADLCVCPGTGNNPDTKGAHTGAPLHKVLQWFKTMTTNEYLKKIHEKGWQRLDGKLWQRNYYERVIRNEKELYAVRKYIQDNPLNWDKDDDNPINILL